MDGSSATTVLGCIVLRYVGSGSSLPYCRQMSRLVYSTSWYLQKLYYYVSNSYEKVVQQRSAACLYNAQVIELIIAAEVSLTTGLKDLDKTAGPFVEK